MKQKIKKIIFMFTTFAISIQSVFADVVGEVGTGGNIANSVLGQGIFNIVKDITGTFQWLIPVAGVGVILFDIFRISTGDEQDSQRYKKNIVKVLICVVIGLVAVTIVNLVAQYFGK